MKVTRDLAKKQIDVYGQLLVDHAVIGDIVPSEKRGMKVFTFDIMSPKFTYAVECVDVKELALVLSSMWSAYEKAREALGVG